MSNQKKSEQLGMPFGTAGGKLRKAIIFDLIQKTGMDKCYQCGERISAVAEMSIEHKIPWLDSRDPKVLFFDMENIAFSHLSCNCAAADKTRDNLKSHPSYGAYQRGCRCNECKELARIRMTDYRKRRKIATGKDR